MSAPAAQLVRRPRRARSRPASLARVAPGSLLAVGLGLLLAAVALGGGGGLQLGRATSVEIALQGTGGLLGAAAVLLTGGRRLHGALTLGVMAVLAALTATSVVWAVQPDDAWLEASRTLAYLATLGAGVALVRLAPGRWGALVGATVIASGLVTAYALATKVFPTSLNPDETLARLREPFGYWNAVGLMAALGGPGCLWLGARRHGHAALNAIAYPVLSLLIVGVLLAYSRGALLALVLGCAVWFVVVPLRLRGAAVLVAATFGALLVVTWVFAQDPLTTDAALLDLRETSGHQFGVLLVAMSLALLAVGLATGFATARNAPRPALRRRAGVALLVALALVPVAVAGGLALSDRGLSGSVSDAATQLFDPNAGAKASPGNVPGRLTAVGSVRARYFADSLTLFEDRPLLGSGAGGFATARPRVRPDELDVRHSHGYVFQTLADLGAAGAAVTLALLLAWAVAALRATALLRPRAAPRPVVDAELVGLRTLLAVVVVFGVHSFVDWTWFVPGPTVLALLCAGWLTGRGPSRGPGGELLLAPEASAATRTRLRDRPRALAALGLLVVAAGAAWATYQPLRSVNRGNDALSALEAGQPDRARALAREAGDIDPLSVEPLFTLAAIEQQAGRPAAARVAYQRAVQLQPQNPSPWLHLAEFDRERGENAGALSALRPALYLDPRSATTIDLFLQVSRAQSSPAPAKAKPTTKAKAKTKTKAP